MSRIALAVALLLVAAAPALATPSDGNGNKVVIPVDDSFTVACDGTELQGHLGGWVTLRTFQGQGNRNLELTVYHFVVTYTNDAGQSWTYRDVGPDHLSTDKNGDLILTVTGRPGDPTGAGFSLSGHVVINLTTGEVVAVRGNQGPFPDDAACTELG